jgi:catechol 2,3-dioxygenase-like lactoylglutathione lyase family enzyme
MSVQGFHTIVLQVSDLPRSIAFYEAALGLSFARQSDRAAQAKLGPSALLLHVE